jgi:hypothetical protein
LIDELRYERLSRREEFGRTQARISTALSPRLSSLWVHFVTRAKWSVGGIIERARGLAASSV